MRGEQTKWSMLRVACLQNLDNKKNKPLKKRTERRETVSGGYHLRLADSERTASAEDRTKQKMRKVLKSKSAFRPGLLDLFLALFLLLQWWGLVAGSICRDHISLRWALLRKPARLHLKSEPDSCVDHLTQKSTQGLLSVVT